MTGKPNPRRITMALNARELYGPEVDIACGGVEPMVDLWEAGKLTPTEAQLQRLAKLTGYPVTFFYKPAAQDPPPFVGFICQRGGRGKGCTRIDERPDAEILSLHPETLF